MLLILLAHIFMNVDLLSFDTSKAKDMSNIFYNFDEAHEANIKIYFKIWNIFGKSYKGINPKSINRKNYYS